MHRPKALPRIQSSTVNGNVPREGRTERKSISAPTLPADKSVVDCDNDDVISDEDDDDALIGKIDSTLK